MELEVLELFICEENLTKHNNCKCSKTENEV